MTVSFIIPAHNEESRIAATLAAIDESGQVLGQPFEIVVVDDSSTDGTARIAEEHGARVVKVNCRQIAATRNAGAAAAVGDMLVFVDADTIVEESVVRAAAHAMHQGAVGGGCRVRFDGDLPLFGRVLATLVVPIYAVLGLAAGCFIFCTRDAFNEVGGFDETLFAAEEVAMSRQLRRQGTFVILRDFVTTSGRKLRTYSGWEIIGSLLRIAVGGSKSVKQRDGLEIWYGKRRTDPQQRRK
jgi:glycosyltransferase involved in cell wall biosynthesis